MIAEGLAQTLCFLPGHLQKRVGSGGDRCKQDFILLVPEPRQTIDPGGLHEQQDANQVPAVLVSFGAALPIPGNIQLQEQEMLEGRASDPADHLRVPRDIVVRDAQEMATFHVDYRTPRRAW